MTDSAHPNVQSSAYPCPLCAIGSTALFHQDKKREYWQCQHCQLIFVPPPFHLDLAQEKSIYDLHTNHPEDPGYRQFLMRFVTPFVAHAQQFLPAPPLNGLDFGSGPGPALSSLLEGFGFQCANYDIYYAKYDELLTAGHYDFVTSTEVVEHLARPDIEFKRLFSLLKPNRCLAIMTKRSDSYERFVNWHYIQDPTHICFYNEVTFNWIAKTYSAQASFPEKDVVIFQTV